MSAYPVRDRKLIGLSPMTNAPIQAMTHNHFQVGRSRYQTSSGFLACGLTLALGVAATGSISPAYALVDIRLGDKKVNVVEVRSADPRRNTDVPADTGTTVEDLAWLKESGVSFSSVANLLGVTRKTLYAWAEGASSRGNRSERVGALRDVLESIPSPVERASFMDLVDAALGSGVTVRSLLNDASRDRQGLESSLRMALDELAPKIFAAAHPYGRVRNGSYADDYAST